MKVKVFQLQQKKFDSEGNIIPRDKRKNKIVCIESFIRTGCVLTFLLGAF